MAATKWRPVWHYARKIFKNLPRRFVVPRGSCCQKRLCNAHYDWITSCRSQPSISNFFAGTNFCSRSEMEIRSPFFLRVGSSPLGNSECRMKSISYFDCGSGGRGGGACIFGRGGERGVGEV